MQWIAYATGQATTFFSQNTGYMPVRKSALTGPEMADWYAKHPTFKTAIDQLPKTRPQDSARVFIPGGDDMLGKALDRVTTNGEPADTVFKEVAAELTREAQPVIAKLKQLGA
jgi:sn-glycerol 3-phosphate transport system substrate-binding protein